jgi:hypothetical protein
MEKKLINEDISNMKYLFGYKPGRVISEQDIDYTTEDFSHDEIDEEEMEEGYKYDDVDETNPDDVEDDVFGDFDLSQLGLDDEEDMENGEELYPSFSSDEEFLGMSKPNGDMDTEDEDTLFEQEEPENDRYMFFSNLQQIHRQMGILLEKDPEMIHSILENGHDWAQDHIATAKESIDQVFDFIMNEENGDDEEDFEDNNI